MSDEQQANRHYVPEDKRVYPPKHEQVFKALGKMREPWAGAKMGIEWATTALDVARGDARYRWVEMRRILGAWMSGWSRFGERLLDPAELMTARPSFAVADALPSVKVARDWAERPEDERHRGDIVAEYEMLDVAGAELVEVYGYQWGSMPAAKWTWMSTHEALLAAHPDHSGEGEGFSSPEEAMAAAEEFVLSAGYKIARPKPKDGGS